MPRNTMGEPQMTKEDKERHRRYQAEDDFRTLGRAAEIHADEDRKAAVIEMHQEHAAMLKKMFSSDGNTAKSEGKKEEERKEPGSGRKRN